MQNPLKKVGLILFLLAVGAGSPLFAQDVPMPTVVVIPLENVLAEEIYQTIVRVFPEVNSDCQSNRLAPDRNSNSLVMVSFALPEFTQIIEGLVKKLDVPRKVLGQPKKELPQQAENIVKVYHLRNRLAKDVVASFDIPDKSNFRVLFDDVTNSLIFVASPEAHERFARMVDKLDQPPKQVLPVAPQQVPNPYQVPQQQNYQNYNVLPPQILNPYPVPPQPNYQNAPQLMPNQYEAPPQLIPVAD